MDKARRLTRAQAEEGQEFHWGECTRTHGPRGGVRESIERWRRTGATKLWKTRPEDFRVPVQFGMRARDHHYLTPDNVEEFHLDERCPLEDTEYRQVLPDGQVIEIAKRGGGTLGKKYDGNWDVVITDRNGRGVLEDTISTSTPKTHAEVEEIALGFGNSGG